MMNDSGNKTKVLITVNGEPFFSEIDDNTTLLDYLRHNLHLTGTKCGCGEGSCGACTVIVDGLAVNACCYLACKANGKQVLTIEGLASNGKLHPLQMAFIEEGAVQCGFCTPGMIMSALALLNTNPHPSIQEIKKAIAGNICRCTGYKRIINAIIHYSNTLK